MEDLDCRSCGKCNRKGKPSEKKGEMRRLGKPPEEKDMNEDTIPIE